MTTDSNLVTIIKGDESDASTPASPAPNATPKESAVVTIEKDDNESNPAITSASKSDSTSGVVGSTAGPAAADPEKPHDDWLAYWADRFLQMRKDGTLSAIPADIFYQLAINAANEEEAKSVAKDHLEQLFPNNEGTKQHMLDVLNVCLSSSCKLDKDSSNPGQYILRLVSDDNRNTITGEDFAADDALNHRYRGWLFKHGLGSEYAGLTSTVPNIENINVGADLPINLEDVIQSVDFDKNGGRLIVKLASSDTSSPAVSEVTIAKDNLTASDTKAATLAALIVSAKELQGLGWKSFKITPNTSLAEGDQNEHLINTARAFTANGFKLDGQTQTAVIMAIEKITGQSFPGEGPKKWELVNKLLIEDISRDKDAAAAANSAFRVMPGVVAGLEPN